MRRGLFTLVVLGAFALPASASAATLPSDFASSCPTENPSGDSYGGVQICSGTVPV